MTYSLLSVSEYETTKLCLIDCGDGSTVELTFPIAHTEEEILQGASHYREHKAAYEAEQAAAEAELKAKIDEQ